MEIADKYKQYIREELDGQTLSEVVEEYLGVKVISGQAFEVYRLRIIYLLIGSVFRGTNSRTDSDMHTIYKPVS